METKDVKNQGFLVYLDNEQKQQVVDAARKDNRTISSFCRDAALTKAKEILSNAE